MVKNKKVVKEYLTLFVQGTSDATQDMLDKRGEQGWKLICSYSRGRYLIMERDKEIKICECCGKKKNE